MHMVDVLGTCQARVLASRGLQEVAVGYQDGGIDRDRFEQCRARPGASTFGHHCEPAWGKAQMDGQGGSGGCEGRGG